MEQEEVAEGVCTSTLDGVRCMLDSNHVGAIWHTAVTDGGLKEWEVGDEAKEKGSGDDYWRGYYWPDVLAAFERTKRNDGWAMGTISKPEGDGPIVWKSDLDGATLDLKDKHTDAFRKNGLRKETEDDYVWRGYTLKEIKEANERHCSMEIWYIEKGEIWAKGRSPVDARVPWKPFGGGASFIAMCVARGWLQPKTEAGSK